MNWFENVLSCMYCPPSYVVVKKKDSKYHYVVHDIRGSYVSVGSDIRGSYVSARGFLSIACANKSSCFYFFLFSRHSN